MFSIDHITRLYAEPEKMSSLLMQLRCDEDNIYEKWSNALDRQTDASARLNDLNDKEAVTEYNIHTIRAGLLGSRLHIVGNAKNLCILLSRYNELPSSSNWQDMIACSLNGLIKYNNLSRLLELTCWIESCRRYTNHNSPERPEHIYICFLINKTVSFLDREYPGSLSSEDKLVLSNALQGLRTYCEKWPDYSLPSGGGPKRSYREGSTEYQVFLEVMECYCVVIDLTQKHFEHIVQSHPARLGRMNPVFYTS